MRILLKILMLFTGVIFGFLLIFLIFALKNELGVWAGLVIPILLFILMKIAPEIRKMFKDNDRKYLIAFGIGTIIGVILYGIDSIIYS